MGAFLPDFEPPPPKAIPIEVSVLIYQDSLFYVSSIEDEIPPISGHFDVAISYVQARTNV